MSVRNLGLSKPVAAARAGATHRKGVAVVALAAMSSLAMMTMLAPLSGCRDERTDEPPRQFIPDMDDSPKMKPQSGTAFFTDGRSMRPRVVGTVAFGGSSKADDAMRTIALKEPAEVFQGVDTSKAPGKDGAPVYVKFMPSEVLDMYTQNAGSKGVVFASREDAFKAQIARGQERFNIFCAACHGYNGEGGNPALFTGGVVGRRWAYPVPSYHESKYTDRDQPTGSDGYLFHVIRAGVPDADPSKPGKMPSYADKIDEMDAWAIVAYVRVIQTSWQEGMDRVPADQRPALERSRPKMPAPEAGKQTSQAVPASPSTPESASRAQATGTLTEARQ